MTASHRSISLIVTLYGIITVSEAINNVPDYDQLQRELRSNIVPTNENGQPTTVAVGMYVESVGALDTNDGLLPVNIFFRLSWVDPGLRGYEGLITNPKASWGYRPDIVFFNAETADFHKVTVDNFSFRIFNNGTVAYSTRLRLVINCPMDLSEYPLDRQKCPLKLGSYARTIREQPVQWFDHNPIEYDTSKIKMSGYTLMKVDPDNCSDKQSFYSFAKTQQGHLEVSDEFGCLEAQFYLQRQIGYHLVQTYIPTCLIVMISWVGFWIDPKAVPARVSLNFTTLITLMTMGTGIRMHLPQVSYAKAIDWWFGACTVFVFAALCEFAMCNFQLKRSDHLKTKAQETMSMSKKKLPGLRVKDEESANGIFGEEKNDSENSGFQAAVFTLASVGYRKRSYYLTCGYNFERFKDWHNWAIFD